MAIWSKKPKTHSYPRPPPPPPSPLKRSYNSAKTLCHHCDKEIVLKSSKYFTMSRRDIHTNIKSICFHDDCFEEVAGKSYVDSLTEDPSWIDNKIYDAIEPIGTGSLGVSSRGLQTSGSLGYQPTLKPKPIPIPILGPMSASSGDTVCSLCWGKYPNKEITECKHSSNKGTHYYCKTCKNALFTPDGKQR